MGTWMKKIPQKYNITPQKEKMKSFCKNFKTFIKSKIDYFLSMIILVWTWYSNKSLPQNGRSLVYIGKLAFLMPV